MNEDDKPAKVSDDKAIIDEAKSYLEFCITAEGDNRRAGVEDLNFAWVDQWDTKARRDRELDGRPCLTINKLPTFLHQVTNDQRQNVPSIKVSPVDSGADVKTAEVIQGWIRHTEYASNADVAYDTAVNSAASIGFGYFRLVTDYCREDSFDQDIRFKRIRNPFTVYFDPASEEPDGSDAKRCMISGKMDRQEFCRQYPDAEAASQGLQAGAGDASTLEWLGEKFVRVAEYYRMVLKTATLVELTNGEVGWKDKLIELPAGVTIKRSRESARKSIEWFKLTALDVLERTEILCDWIPVFPVYGDEVDIDGKVMRSGIIRYAKDPSRMYSYWMTAATEEVALRTKTPFIGAEGQFEGYEEDWGQANVRSFSYLEYKPVTLDGALAPAPQRQPMADVPQGMLAMAMHANDNIKATTGLFDSSLGARGNATSGVQERQQQLQGNIANFHYSDNLNRSVRQAGRCLISMMPHYLDAPRIIRVMGEDGKMDHAEVNQPVPPEQQKPDPRTGAIQTILNDLTVGEYDVVVKAGPSYSTLRQEAAEQMVNLGGKWPKLMDVAGDKVIASMDWPGAEEISERIKKTIPPQVLGDEDGEQDAPMVQTPKGPIPVDQAGQMLVEMDQQMQAMGQELTDYKAGITKAKIDAASRENVAEINAVSKADVAELTGVIQLLIAKMQPPSVLAADVAQDIAGNDSQPIRPADSPPADSGAPGNASPMGESIGSGIPP